VLIFLNGQFVPEERAVVSVLDRSFLYGDGLFETMLVVKSKPFRWHDHLVRLQRGADFLKIKIPYSAETLRGFADELIAKNQMSHALLRLTLSRGVGARGYAPIGADNPTLVMTLHPAPPADTPPRWNLLTASTRLPANEPLAQFKTCNKLPQILARIETAAAGADEALLLNTDGYVVEGSSSNLFWIEGDTICTPPLASGILSGVTRAVVLEICQSLHLKTRESQIRPDQLLPTDGVFVSLSSFGIVEAQSLNGQSCKHSSFTAKISQAYRELIEKETA